MRFDVAVIGGGIAGASVAAALAPHASVVLLEAEDQPGYHSTGRSAAFWHETLGGPLVHPLTVASGAWLAQYGFLKPRQSLYVAEAQDLALLDAMETSFSGIGMRMRRMDHAAIVERVPAARDVLVAGLLEENCSDIDVGGLHQFFLAAFRRAGGIVETGFRVDRMIPGWQISSGDRTIEARIVVNAAGAWADMVARHAGAAPLGIQPMRRTIAQVRIDGSVPAELPLVMDIAGSYYFRPEGPDRLWLCPHDETPVEAHDVAPEEIDVAYAIDRFEAVTDWRVIAVERKWAGLRSFAPDRLPVYGYDPRVPDFFWCAGQGGYGIQTAPAAAALAAAQVLGRVPDAIAAEIDPLVYSPARFGR